MVDIIGLDIDETLNGGLDADIIWANGGADRVDGGNSDDTIWGGWNSESSDTLNGGNGNDIVGGDEGDDFVYGDNGDDSLYGWTGNDRLSGENGNDLIIADPGQDTAYGGNGDDALWGGTGNDALYGENGADYIAAEEGHDSASGGESEDTIFGGQGNDTLHGDEGNDVIYGDDEDNADGYTSISNNITATGYDPEGGSIAVSFTESGNVITFGNTLNGGRFDTEIDFFPNRGSERLVVDFGAANVSSATVDLRAFYNDYGNYPEVAKWKTFDANGNELGYGEYLGSQASGQYGELTITVDGWGANFKSIVFYALDDYDPSSDNSDFAVSKITYTTSDVKDYIKDSNDYITGGQGNDYLHGMQGADTIIGGADGGEASEVGGGFTFSTADELLGGNGKDLFIYEKFDGVDRIADFQVGYDCFALDDYGTDYTSVIEANLHDVDGGALLYLGDNQAVLFAGVNSGDFSASDFILS